MCHFSFKQVDDRWTDEWTDICECRVAFATENLWVESLQFSGFPRAIYCWAWIPKDNFIETAISWLQKFAISSNIILKLSRSELKFYKNEIGIEYVNCNFPMFGRAKVTKNENLLDNDSSVLSSLVTIFIYIEGVNVTTWHMSVTGSQIQSRIDPWNDTEYFTIALWCEATKV